MNFGFLSLPAAMRRLCVWPLLVLVLVGAPQVSAQTTTDGSLQMEVITAYNFVVDSNVESPSSFSPSAAHLGVKICNTGAAPLTNVEVNIGNLIDPPTSSGTPGVFASRTVTVTGAKGYAGTFALQMPGGAADAVRTIPSLAAGECVVQYFFVTYPLKDPAGNAVTGAGPDPSDDLWLNYDIWAKAEEGATTRRVSETTRVTMRSEISAMANKIWPNTASKVPAKYLDAIEASLGWRPDTNMPKAGSTAQMEGIWYDLGNVGAGFDNDGDGLPDRNAWMQPVGDPSLYDPLCVRLVKCYGIVIVKLNNGTEQLIPFEDRLYFENIAEKNTGAVGLVFYEFIPLAAGCTAALSPYQEVASGHDNEKFNGDYGASNVAFTTVPPSMNFDKSGPALIAGGGTATYTLTAENTDTTGIGLPGLSLPFVFEDAIPAGLVYVAGSATAANTIPAGNSVTVSWSTDGGVTWVTTEPAASSVTHLRWTLGAALAPGTTAIVGFQATVPLSYPSVTIDNTGVAKLGPTGSLDTSTVTTLLTGINSIGDLVWKDTNRDSIKDAGESGIPNITVSLYYDTNGNGALDPSEPLYGTTVTDGSGLYSFASLPDGNYIVEIDGSDGDLPAGSILPDAVGTSIAVDLDAARVVATPVDFLDADWPFIDALVILKTTSPTTYGAGELVTYAIDLENRAAAVAPKTTPVRTAWATTVTGSRAVQNGANAQGAPDASYARIDFQANSDTLTTSGGFTYADPNGTITKVELVFNGYLSQALVDDQLDATVNGTLFSTISTAELNTLLGPARIFAVDVTSLNASWSWAQVQALTAELKANKTASPDPGVVWVDSLGYRVTTTAVPPPAGSYGLATIDPLPLTDTFDPARLAYVSSSLLPTSVVGGTITWNNAGPLNPGARKTITVVFRALTTPTAVNTTNTASSSGAVFVSGNPANSATDNIAITINPRGEIGDFVFWDLNNNGAFDPGEPGIPNVLVTLDNGAQTRTDANGFYIFRNLADATYTVTVDTGTLPWTSFSQTVDPDATVDNASTVPIDNSNVPTTDDGYLDRDFGYSSTSNVISGVLFQDDNGNGIKDAGEVFLSGVTVTLSGAGSGSTTTDSSGYYSFGSLADGTYTVTVTPPAGTTQTLDPDATVNNATSVVASGGNLYANRDFAYMPTGTLSIGDTVYYDWNGNGTQDAGEGGIADIDVLLYRDTNGNGVIDGTDDPLVATTATDASGIYGLGSLPAGDYVVVVDTFDPQFPAGVVQIEDYDGTRDSKAEVNLTISLLTVDFGYEPQGTASIGDAVFLDANGDGLKDTSEAGIANVTVTLYADTNNNGVIDVGSDAVVGVTTTDSDGSYLFNGLPAGDYLVDVDQNDASIPSDALGNKYGLTTTDPHDVTLLAGEVYTAADFGFAAPASIGDFVFFDSNGNGTQDLSEDGIPNVTVELYLDANEDGLPDSPTPIATTVTADGTGVDPAGFYQFTDLGAGTYYVKVLTSTLPQSGGSPIPQTSDPDRDGVPVGDNTYPGLPPGDDADSLVIVSLGSNYLGADFGYQPSGALGDFVWLDLNQDGIQDDGEPGIANVTVRISDGVTDYDVMTDFDGSWSVANIPDGAWTVSVLPSNFALGGPLENTVNSYDADGGTDSSAAIVLTNGTVDLPVGNLGLDFGYALNGSSAISGTVLTHDTRVLGTADDPDDFYDDGVDQDGGPDDEIELAGIVVYLYTTSGTFLGTTETDEGGNYSFSGLPPGDYRVIIGTTTQELQNSTLTTTAANNPAVTSVNDSSGTTVIQTLTVGASDVTDVDFAFISDVDYDYGDLPLSYAATTLSQDGARHIIPPGGSTLYLGTAPDADTNGIPTSLADGDDVIGSDDEDGVVPLSPTSWTDGTVVGGNGGSLQVNVTGSGWLVGWIDWNGDGDFLDADEMVASQAVTTGSPTIGFDIPAGTIGASSASWLSRFRVFPSEPAYPLFSYTGTATEGEVEDHLIEKLVGASIGDLVWNDVNGNGLFDTGEDGMGGLTVELRDGGGTLVGTQVTSDGTVDVDGDGVVDPAGYYRFRELAADTYTVTVANPPAGFSSSYDEDGLGTAHVTSVNLASGEQHLSADFGYAPLLADISGQVRYDTDADGDLGDPDSGAMVVRIQLWTDPNGDGDPSDGVQVGETYTDANGDYIFSGVPTGNYVVVEINPADTTSTADVEGANDDRIAVALSGSDVTGRDFLDTQPPVYEVGGTVYTDNPGTNDNVIGVDDTPVAAVLLNLFLDRDQDGVVSAGDTLLSSTVTDTAGGYSFTGLPAGDYVVQEIDPSGASSDWDAQGSPTDNQIAVSIVDADLTGRDFLDDGVVTSAISGQVTDGSDPIPGVTITLKDDQGNVIGTTVTDTNGNYSFPNLPDGSYTVEETNPAGTTGGSDADGPGNGDDTIAVTLAGGGGSTGNDFVDTGSSLATLSGTVYDDGPLDSNVIDGDDSPIAGVLLTLYQDSNGNGLVDVGEPVLGSTVTDTNGDYSFANLPDGDYVVVETNPAGTTSDDFDTQGALNDSTIGVSLAGVDSTGNDFLDDGLTTYTVAGQVSDGTDPIPGVTVTLKDGSGNVIDTAVTDSSGSYSFPNLPAGNYTVEETDPVGTTGGSDKDGGDPNLITITGLAADSLDNDFVDTGFTRETISGTVYNDTDENNLIDPGSDTPIGAVTLSLVSDSNGNGVADPGEPVIMTTVSSVDGSYSFGGLPQGDYVVVESDPSGAVSENDTDGVPTDNNVGVTLAGTGDSTGNDFLDDGIVTSAISGQVTDGSDPIPGVTITLKDDQGNVIATTVTDTNGNYSFPNLPDGSYTVEETNPAGTTGGSDVDGPGNGDDTIAVTLAGGGGSTGNDFVDTGSSLATLSGTVYDDGPLDSNVIDGDDSPIAGVLLTLYQDSNGNGLVDVGEPVLGSTVTDTNGDYSFANLPDGDYVVVETNPAGTTSDDFDTQGAPNDSTIGVSLAGVDSTGNDFLDDGLTTYTVAGQVSDGTDPIPGVTVTLKDGSGNVIDTAVTDSSGSYSFPNLPAGNYTVEETDPVGTTGGSDKDGGDPNLITITGLAADSLDNDFVDTGFTRETISGTVYNDTDENNLIDPGSDTPIGAVTLSLVSDSNGNGVADPGEPVIMTTVTSVDGSYSFGGLPQGDYVVVESDPSGATSENDTDGVPTDNNVGVTLAGTGDSTGNDFLDDGIVTSAISGQVTNGNHPIPGVTITLKDDQGNVIATTVTDGNGDYTFPNLPDGSYTVEETNPPRTTGGSDADGPGNGDDTIAVTLTGGDSTGNDFVDLRSKAQLFDDYLIDNGLTPGTPDGQPLPDGGGSGGNPDGDWASNLLEHAFCDTSTSGVPNHPGFCVELANAATGQIDATFIRPEGVQDVIYTLQGADSMLGPWFTIGTIAAGQPAGGGFTALSNGDDTETVTYANVQNDAGYANTGFGFARLCVSLDSEPDGTPDTVVLPSDGSSVEATDYTRAFGWQCVDYNQNECASFSHPYSNKPVFTGMVDGNLAAGATVDATGSAGGVDLASLNLGPIDLDPGAGVQLVPTHYLQITSGLLEGERFDIAGASGGVLTLVNDPDIFTGPNPALSPGNPTLDSLNTSSGVPADGILAGESFQVLPHKTVDQLFDRNGAFAGLQSTSDETRLLFFDNRNESKGFATLSLADTGSEVKWVYLGDPDAIDQGSRPVDRCTGSYIHSQVGATMVCGVGLVADYDLACPFNEGYNLAGAPYPMNQTPTGTNGRAMVVGSAADQFKGAGTPSQSSELLRWRGDEPVDELPAVVPYLEGYQSFMAADDGGTFQRWVDPNDPALPDLGIDAGGPLLLPSWRAITVKLLSGNTLTPHVYPLPGP